MEQPQTSAVPVAPNLPVSNPPVNTPVTPTLPVNNVVTAPPTPPVPPVINTVVSTPVPPMTPEASKKKSSAFGIVVALLLVGILGVSGYLYRDTLVQLVGGTPTPTPTQVPTKQLTLVAPPIALTAEVGKVFTFQIRVIDILSSPTYQVTELSGAQVSTTGLVSWTPTTEGRFTGKVAVTDTNAYGEMNLSIVVTKAQAEVVDKYKALDTFTLPAYPVFFVAQVNNYNQLWVMNKDGSEQKYTGITSLGAKIENLPNFGGVIYTVDDTQASPKGTTQSIYIFSVSTKKTLKVLPQITIPKGQKMSLGSGTLSPSGKYLVMTMGTYKPTDMGADDAYYAYNISNGEQKKVALPISVSFRWYPLAGESMLLVNNTGVHAVDVWTGAETLLSSTATGISSEYDVAFLDDTTSLFLTGTTETPVNLTLKKGSNSQVVDTSAWAGLQGGYCVSPDKKTVLYNFTLHNSENYGLNKIKSLNVASGEVAWVTENTATNWGSYLTSSCYWTSDNTVLLDVTTRENKTELAYVGELNLDTKVIKRLTTTGRASLREP